MTNDNSRLIEELITQAKELPFRDDSRLDALLRRVKLIIQRAFGENSNYLKDLNLIRFYPNWAPASKSTEDKFWKSGQQKLINLLNTMLEDIKLSEPISRPELISPEKIAIGGIANFFGPRYGDQNIDKILEPFGLSGLVGSKSQKIGSLLNALYDNGDMTGIFVMVSSLLTNHSLSENEINKLDALITPLGMIIEEGNLIRASVTTPIVKENYIKISEFPDDFYKDLVNLINQCYGFEIYQAVNVFSRKLLENLLVDILRKKYGMQNIKLFFDTDHGRFYGFNVLITNFAENMSDFKQVMPSLNQGFIGKINKFRESGNSGAHTLEIHVSKEEIEGQKEDLLFLVKSLIRIYKNVHST